MCSARSLVSLVAAIVRRANDWAASTYTGSLSLANNYQFLNDGTMFLHVKNGGGSPDTVTIAAQPSVDGLDVPDRTVLVPAGEERIIGPLLRNVYNDSDGLVNFVHSFITSVTQGVFRL